MKNERQQTQDLGGLLGEFTERIERDLRRWTVEPDTPRELSEAMEYCVLGGGKRLRPAIVHMCARACGAGGEEEILARSATAVELVHCYSLVHDDLPEMDDDSLRRGRATAHVKFGQAMAVLVGDALLTRAFGVLGGSGGDLGVRLVTELADAAGASGMVAGQVADMGLCETPDGVEGLRFIHKRKTGALIRASARMGAICAGSGQNELEAITRWSQLLGLAYQLRDDILDATATAEQIGKTPGKDARSKKRTSIGEMGLEDAHSSAMELADQAGRTLEPLGRKARPLITLTRLLTERTV